MIRAAAAGLCLMALPGVAAASGIPLSTCEDTGARTRSMLQDRRDDRFVMFVEQDLAEESVFNVETSRQVVADCKAGWQIWIPSSHPRANELMHEVYYGETAYDRAGILALFKREGVKATAAKFDRGHCACKVDPSGDTHLVDD